jgi:pSer/pThr/pTyr-binding forkhead associated (FHA) protein
VNGPDLDAPPAGSIAPYLEVNGQRHPLEPPGVVLGRGTEADLRITDPGVSRRHAEIRVVKDGGSFTVTIHDLGSTNGIVVNGQRVDYAALHDGSQILLGNTLLVLRRPGGVR